MTASESPAPPVPITADHLVDQFQCGEAELDLWLQRRALTNQQCDASRTYVACTGRTVLAYYSLCAGGLARASATGKVRRNMPDPIPAIVLGRLAVHNNLKGRGFGAALLLDAVKRCVEVSEVIGVRILLLHAISENAKAFYLKHGFTPSPFEPMTLMAEINDLRERYRRFSQ